MNYSRPTQNDVATRAGVSRGLVSQILTGTDRATPGVRARVLQAAQDLGYRTNYAAAQLASRRSGVIALTVPSLGNPIYHALFEGIAEAGDELGRSVLLAVIGHDDPRAERTTDRLLGLMPEGLVLVDPTEPDDVLQEIASTIPTVVTGRGRTVDGVTSVVIDEARAAQDVVTHLAGRRFTRLVYVTSPWTDAEPNNLIRRGAVAQAAAQAGLTTQFLRCESERAREVGSLAKAAGKMAFVAYNDVLGVEVLAELRESGREFGSEVALVSYDNSQLASNPRTPLTSIDISPREMGRLSVAALSGIETHGEKGVIVPHRLVIRASSTGA